MLLSYLRHVDHIELSSKCLLHLVHVLYMPLQLFLGLKPKNTIHKLIIQLSVVIPLIFNLDYFCFQTFFVLR